MKKKLNSIYIELPNISTLDNYYNRLYDIKIKEERECNDENIKKQLQEQTKNILNLQDIIGKNNYEIEEQFNFLKREYDKMVEKAKFFSFLPFFIKWKKQLKNKLKDVEQKKQELFDISKKYNFDEKQKLNDDGYFLNKNKTKLFENLRKWQEFNFPESKEEHFINNLDQLFKNIDEKEKNFLNSLSKGSELKDILVNLDNYKTELYRFWLFDNYFENIYKYLFKDIKNIEINIYLKFEKLEEKIQALNKAKENKINFDKTKFYDLNINKLNDLYEKAINSFINFNLVETKNNIYHLQEEYFNFNNTLDKEIKASDFLLHFNNETFNQLKSKIYDKFIISDKKFKNAEKIDPEYFSTLKIELKHLEDISNNIFDLSNQINNEKFLLPTDLQYKVKLFLYAVKTFCDKYIYFNNKISKYFLNEGFSNRLIYDNNKQLFFSLKLLIKKYNNLIFLNKTEQEKINTTEKIIFEIDKIFLKNDLKDAEEKEINLKIKKLQDNNIIYLINSVGLKLIIIAIFEQLIIYFNYRLINDPKGENNVKNLVNKNKEKNANYKSNFQQLIQILQKYNN